MFYAYAYCLCLYVINDYIVYYIVHKARPRRVTALFVTSSYYTTTMYNIIIGV
jgi:hypothetical protein